jgi:hypothetical protein
MKFPTNIVLGVFEYHASFIFCKTFYEWVKNDPLGGKGLICVNTFMKERNNVVIVS